MVSSGNQSDCADNSSNTASRYERILAAVGHAVDMLDRPNISAAKQILRERGGSRLASRLGKLSKLRNTEVHDLALEALRDPGKSCHTIMAWTARRISRRCSMAQTIAEVHPRKFY